MASAICEGVSKMRSDYAEGEIQELGSKRDDNNAENAMGSSSSCADDACGDDRSEMEEGQIGDDSLDISQPLMEDCEEGDRERESTKNRARRSSSRRDSLSSASNFKASPNKSASDGRVSKSSSAEGVGGSVGSSASSGEKGLHPKLQEHGSAERFAKPLETCLMSFYKQKVCNHWEKYNKCPYGTLCHFLHPQGEKRKQ